ncbi:MAG: cell division protein FtsQ/DivIB [Roseinatronobacter sp.]
MRPLRHRIAAPDLALGEFASAPNSAGTSFWDHLAATRAEEYAQEDILPTPLPSPPETSVPPLKSLYGAGSVVGPHHRSLDDVLAAFGPSGAASAQSAQSAQPAVSPAEMALQPADLADLPPHARPDLQPPAAWPNFVPEPDVPLRKMRAEPRRKAARRAHRQGSRHTRFKETRLGYRLQRIWLTPAYRALVKYGLPMLMVVAAAAAHLSQESNRQAIVTQVEALVSLVIDRPEFMINELRWSEVSPELDAALRARTEIDLPISSFRLDLDALRERIVALDWIRSAELRLLAEGVLAVQIVERRPSVVWRAPDGLQLLDDEGVRVAWLTRRDLRADLPLIVGAGAQAHVREALDLMDAATPLGDRVQGLVRMGERRWDVVLDRGQRILLPERGALAALERVIALQQAQDLLNRDLLLADLRNPQRPVLRLSAGAVDALRSMRISYTELSR